MAWWLMFGFRRLTATVWMTIVYQAIVEGLVDINRTLQGTVNAMGHVVGLTCGLELGSLRQQPRRARSMISAFLT